MPAITSAIPGSVAINLGPVTRIPFGEGRSYLAGGRIVAVFRSRTGELFATQGECPHRGGPLADGIVGGGKVICPLHAYRFDLASGQPAGNDCEALRTYPVSVSDAGDVILVLDG